MFLVRAAAPKRLACSQKLLQSTRQRLRLLHRVEALRDFTTGAHAARHITTQPKLQHDAPTAASSL